MPRIGVLVRGQLKLSVPDPSLIEALQQATETSWTTKDNKLWTTEGYNVLTSIKGGVLKHILEESSSNIEAGSIQIFKCKLLELVRYDNNQIQYIETRGGEDK